jgi:hypothetical protein
VEEKMEMTSNKKNGSLRKSMGHALGKLGNSLGFGLPKPKPEEPRDATPKIPGGGLGDTNAFAEMPVPSPSPEPEVKQHAMTDRENPENKTPMRDIFAHPDAVHPLSGPDRKVRSIHEIVHNVEPFIKLQVNHGKDLVDHMYSDLYTAIAKDKAEIAKENNLIAQDSFLFGLPGRGKGDPYSQKHISPEQEKAVNPDAKPSNWFPSTENRAKLKQEAVIRGQEFQKQTTSFSDLLRFSPFAITAPGMEMVADPTNAIPGIPIPGKGKVVRGIVEGAEAGVEALLDWGRSDEDMNPADVATDALLNVGKGQGKRGRSEATENILPGSKGAMPDGGASSSGTKSGSSTPTGSSGKED